VQTAQVDGSMQLPCSVDTRPLIRQHANIINSDTATNHWVDTEKLNK